MGPIAELLVECQNVSSILIVFFTAHGTLLMRHKEKLLFVNTICSNMFNLIVVRDGLFLRIVNKTVVFLLFFNVFLVTTQIYKMAEVQK